MATHTIDTGDIGAYELELAADVEDVVNFEEDISVIEVIVHSSTAPIYVTADKTAATVQGPQCFVIPAGLGVLPISIRTSGPTQIRLISAADAVYSIARSAS